MSRRTFYCFIAVIPVLLTVSCGHHPAGNVADPLPVAQVEQVLEQSFQSAPPATQDTVKDIVKATQQHDISLSFTQLKALSSQADLTEDQRIAAIRAANAVGQQLLEAAQNGDAQAAETLHKYRASH